MYQTNLRTHPVGRRQHVRTPIDATYANHVRRYKIHLQFQELAKDVLVLPDLLGTLQD